MKNSIDQVLAAAITTLCETGAARHDARVDARVLLGAVLNADRAWLIAHGDELMAPGKAQAYADLIERRAGGEPVAHLLGRREFWSLDLMVTPDTLIPRPDTETLVAAALDRCPEGAPVRVLNLGTGTGAIALAIASDRPNAQVIAVDVSEPALEVARRNAARLRINNVVWHSGAWFEPLDVGARFELIVSNPPYIAADDHHLNVGDVAHEPRSALVAGDDGYADLEHIIDTAPEHLGDGGWLLLEHGNTQHERVSACFRKARYTQVATLSDLAGQPRVTLGRRA